MIVLAWVSSCPTTWKTFVKHRVHRIQSNVPTAQWYHVAGEENPADCASRGITPEQLINQPLWWNGNNLMLEDPVELPIPDNTLENVQEEKQAIKIHLAVPKVTVDFIFKFSSYNKLKRVTAWLMRFAFNCKQKLKKEPMNQEVILTVEELQQAETYIIRYVQQQQFSKEYTCLKDNKHISHTSNILSLSPFLDNNGVIRVGGRLRNANIPWSRKHPILLPSQHHVTKILVKDYHIKHYHAGSQLLLSIIGQRYWITHAKSTIRVEIRKCTTCARHRAETLTQMMGDFPADRVNPSNPFSKCGVDYCGPFHTRPPTRSKVTLKSWLAVFVCFSTRAVHIEVVESLSTQSFLAALRRFIARRGCPTDVYSDCGTNFIGANREIKDLFAAFGTIKHNVEVANAVSSDGLKWHFNPPNSPHFGGLWEAGVRSVKHHLQRVMGSNRYTYEELLTFVTQIEALLNSRPLVPASSDPNDLHAITPAHLITGGPLLSLPETDFSEIKEGRLSMWQKIQQQKQTFWRRWSNEYISRMQQRPKWMVKKPQIQINDLVIMKDDNLPPARWHLGRVIALHPGNDGITRVVTLKTAQGQYKRAVHRLCLLPVEKKDEDNVAVSCKAGQNVCSE